MAVAGGVVAPARQRMLASLCRRASSAVAASWTSAARMPGTLLAAMEMPMPVEQMRTPSLAEPPTTSAATARAYTG